MESLLKMFFSALLSSFFSAFHLEISSSFKESAAFEFLRFKTCTEADSQIFLCHDEPLTCKKIPLSGGIFNEIFLLRLASELYVSSNNIFGFLGAYHFFGCWSLAFMIQV